jgi:hypothetical protein
MTTPFATGEGMAGVYESVDLGTLRTQEFTVRRVESPSPTSPQSGHRHSRQPRAGIRCGGTNSIG